MVDLHLPQFTTLKYLVMSNLKTKRFSPPPRAVGGAVPFDGMEQYCLDEATDEELEKLIQGDRTPNWLIDETRAELQRRSEENGYEN